MTFCSIFHTWTRLSSLSLSNIERRSEALPAQVIARDRFCLAKLTQKHCRKNASTDLRGNIQHNIEFILRQILSSIIWWIAMYLYERCAAALWCYVHRNIEVVFHYKYFFLVWRGFRFIGSEREGWWEMKVLLFRELPPPNTSSICQIEKIKW